MTRRTILDILDTEAPDGWNPAEHRIRWFGITPRCAEFPDGLVPRNRMMNGADWGWDVKCSCGWESRTGGAIEARVREYAHDHVRYGRVR